jgi:hypothetical protein
MVKRNASKLQMMDISQVHDAVKILAVICKNNMQQNGKSTNICQWIIFFFAKKWLML